MQYLLLTLLLISHVKKNICVSTYLGGVAVPGRTVPILRLFENYAASCRPEKKKDFRMDQLAEILQSFHAEDVAKKVYNSIFFAMADFKMKHVLGKWYKVVDSKSVHKEECAIFYFNSISESKFTATFSSVEYALLNGEVVIYEGYGRMMGSDPGEVLLSTSHPADACPFFPVKLGGVTTEGSYEYMVLSTPLKYPTMVLTRDLSSFEKKYKKEVYEFVEKHGFLSPVAALNTRLHFENTTLCQQKNGLFDRRD